MKKAENKQTLDWTQRDKVEPKGYAGVQSLELGEHLERFDTAHIMWRVVARENMERAIKKVRSNKGAPGIDGITTDDIESHIWTYYEFIVKKLMEGTYKPQPVRRKDIPKPNGDIRRLGIPVVRDRVIQQAIKQIIEPLIDPTFHPNNHGYRPGRSNKTALKQCATYYGAGYHYVVDCDLSKCFDTLNHDKLMHYLEQHIQDKAILHFIRRSLISGVIDLSGEFLASETGAPQGGVLSPLLSNVYLHELDKELDKRGHRFVRYADDFVIYVKSQRAGERVMKSVTQFIEKDLKLIVNQEKSRVGRPTRLKFLGCLIHRTKQACRFRPAPEAKQKFKEKLRDTTKRNRSGSLEDIIKEVNAICRGWINYYGICHMKRFIMETQSWLHHRIRQLLLKRWKKTRTKISQLKQLGLDLDSAKRIAFSRKKYWRLSCTPEVHWALSTRKLREWGLISLTAYAELTYSNY